MEEKNQTNEEEICIWYDGKTVLEVDFCREFLRKHPMIFIDGTFYSTDGVVDIQIVEKMVSDELLAQKVQKDFAKKVTNLVNALKRICFCSNDQVSPDEINVLNGVLKTDGSFSNTKKVCRNRLNVTYNPDAPTPERWLSFLDELLEPDDILTLQEYMGYCLVHSTKAQAMMFITGNGGEGKSRIGVVMNRIFGNAAYYGSITELASDKFLKANLIGKMVLIDDDMNLEGLKDTSFLKSLATSETPVTVQAKGKQGIQVNLKCRVMCFSNGAPKSLYDKTDGWERRIILLSAKPVRPGRVNDPFLSEKLLAETDSIFLWAFEGLKRLISRDFKFTISDSARNNIAKMKEDNCNIISFLMDEQIVKFGADLECSTADLYGGYCYWCSINSATAFKKESLSQWLKQNHRKYGLIYSDYVTSTSTCRKARGYQGISTTYRSTVK